MSPPWRKRTPLRDPSNDFLSSVPCGDADAQGFVARALQCAISRLLLGVTRRTGGDDTSPQDPGI